MTILKRSKTHLSFFTVSSCWILVSSTWPISSFLEKTLSTVHPGFCCVSDSSFFSSVEKFPVKTRQEIWITVYQIKVVNIKGVLGIWTVGFIWRTAVGMCTVLKNKNLWILHSIVQLGWLKDPKVETKATL